MRDFVLPVDKPPGRTSHDAVAELRREIGRGVKVGHSGTLDPFATGLLLLLAGRATRTQRLFMALDKTYEARARFGVTSTTGDPEGELTETGKVPVGELDLPTGTMRQRPPAWSAVKVGGVRAYRLARAGIEPTLEEREVVVHEFVETARSDDCVERSFRIRCSSGTYVRSLVQSLGDAYCVSLRRTAIGPFPLEECVGRRLELGEALGRFMPRLDVSPEQATDLIHGKVIDPDRLAGHPEADTEVLALEGERLVAVARMRDDGLGTVIGFPPD